MAATLSPISSAHCLRLLPCSVSSRFPSSRFPSSRFPSSRFLLAEPPAESDAVPRAFREDRDVAAVSSGAEPEAGAAGPWGSVESSSSEPVPCRSLAGPESNRGSLVADFFRIETADAASDFASEADDAPGEASPGRAGVAATVPR